MPAQIAESGTKYVGVFACVVCRVLEIVKELILFFYRSVMNSLWKGNTSGEQQQDESLRIFFYPTLYSGVPNDCFL